ncbi:MAG TPA: type III pantothenate kinase [Saprospiraceae bacterium]|nr:type III pantothenate kinase [Saprospiraceae bacterium]HRP42255.1 type III pantothenate kinase [Saprospiraceae bacterium]
MQTDNHTILAIDTGNSNIVIALYQDGKWSNTFAYETKKLQPEFYYESALRSILLEWNIPHPSVIQHAVISSVVPDLNDILISAVHNVTGIYPLLINPEVLKNLDIYVPLPYEIGSDLVANAYAAIRDYHDKCIIVDFGTALTFTAVDRSHGILGVTIAPGLKTAMYALFSKTAQLPVVPLEIPQNILGHDTVSAIQSGVLHGYVGLVREIVGQIKKTLSEDYKVIATGGLSAVLLPLDDLFDYKNRMLTLDGIKHIYLHQLNSKYDANQ